MHKKTCRRPKIYEGKKAHAVPKITSGKFHATTLQNTKTQNHISDYSSSGLCGSRQFEECFVNWSHA